MAVTITHSTPADGTFSATGAAAWDASHSVSGLGTMAEQNSNNVNITGGSITGVTGVLTGLTVNSTPTSGGAAGQIMFDTGSVLQESSNLVWDNTAKRLTLTGYSLTGTSALSQLDLSGTWNTTGTPTAIKLNITDTASNAASLLMDLQVGGTSRVNFRKDGRLTITAPSAANSSIVLSSPGLTNTPQYSINATYQGTAANFIIYDAINDVTPFNIRANGTSPSITATSTTSFAWNNSVRYNETAPDLFLTRRGAANLRLGLADAAAPVAQTLSVQSVVAGTSNTAGANLTITGSQGTGTGAGGSIIFQTAPAGSTGTAQNALATALTISGNPLSDNYLASLTSTVNGFGGLFLRNTNGGAGTFASTGFTAQNNTTSSLYARVYGSGVTGVSIWGITNANYSALLSDGAASNGLLVGTLTATPIVFGTNTAEAFRVTSTQQIQIGSSNQFGWSTDLILTRRGAANLRLGAADAAAPVAQTLSVQSVVAGTSNTAGANLTITGSQGTGTGAGGSIIFQVAPAGASGTAQNALSTALTIASNGQVYRGSPTTATLNGGYGFVVQGSRLNTPGLFQIASEDTGSSDPLGGGVFAVISNDGAAMASGDRLGIFSFVGSSSASAVRASVALQAFANQNWVDASAYGSRFEFATTANNSTTRTTRLIIGNSGIITFGATEANTVPALKPSSTILQVRLADDSAYAPVEASTVRTATAYTVATLPAAGTAGRKAYVTDALAPTFLGALMGGGTVVCPVFDTGTQWVAG